MYSFSFRTTLFFLFSLFSIFAYYFLFSFHGDTSSLTLTYSAIIIFLYVCYKAFSIGLAYEKVTFTPASLFMLFSLHLFILCYIFFSSSGVAGVYSIYLLFRILFFVVAIGMFFLIAISFGKTCLDICLKDFHKRDHTFQILISFGAGFSLFLLFLSMLAISGTYTLLAVLILISVLCLVSYRQLWAYIKDLWEYKIEFKNHQLESDKIDHQLRPYLITTEFLFIVVTLVISVNFISVVRPFPIGWDDLGAYMNFPKLISAAGGNIALGKMYLGELFTGIGFLFNSQTFAFFINSFSAVVAFFVTYFGSKLIVPKIDKPAININFLIATVFVSLPMVIFQVAKDMKLDIGLYAISFLAVVLSIYVFLEKKHFHKKEYYSYLFVIGILIGVAFAIKITSLLLLLGILAVASFHYLKITGFFAYICIFISVFTFAGLWTLMKLLVPDDAVLIYTVSAIFGFIGGGLLLYSVLNTGKKHFPQLVVCVCTILLGAFVVLFPWQLKHLSEVRDGKITVGKILEGVPDKFSRDYSKIYSPKELELKEKLITDRTVSSTGSTLNEDFGRYFGYEKGINNYLKLPWNLTMQVNQKGEFTDISYIFFALIPAIFLFLPFRRKVYVLPIVGVLFLEVLYFSPGIISLTLTNLFSHIGLPLGYAVLFIPVVVSFSYFYYFLDKSYASSKVFLYVYAFTALYYFLWSIAAFGIVWYGIVMYGAFLLLSAISISSLFERGKHKKGETISYLVFAIIGIYFLQSTIPHALTNLKRAGNIAYKTGEISEHQGLFKSHPEYLDILFGVNIDDAQKEDFIESYKNQILSELQGLRLDKNIFIIVNNAKNVATLEYVFNNLAKLQSVDQPIEVNVMRKNIGFIHQQFYTDIISPHADIQSDAGVYRAGTFLKYFITKNNSRLLEDNLLTVFDTYFYDENDTKNTFERMKKLGISYLLIDLNAATIDRDPRKDLTRRYENILLSLTSDNAEIVKTDSVCLQLGLDVYKSDPNSDVFLQIAGVNHRGIKSCLNAMYHIIHSEELSNFPYLQNYKIRIDADIAEKSAIYTQVKNQMQQQGEVYADSQQGDISEAEVYVAMLGKYVNQGFKALIKIQ